MKISIIIPVLNEERNIAKIIKYLIANSNKKYSKEIIVVDGGSIDNTINIIKEFPEVIIEHSVKGRGIQMNVGARIATGDILYFLHCDSFPPNGFDKLIINSVLDGYLSGCFKMKFDSNHIVLKVSQWFTKFNFKSCRGGDQSLFVTKELFFNTNGYNENLTIYEDNDLIFRLYEHSNFKVIQENVITSARRYRENGFFKLQFHFAIIHLLHRTKIYNQNQIVDYYKKNIR